MASGSLEAVTLDSINFRVMHDAVATIMPSQEVEAILNSGDSDHQITKASPNIEGIVLQTDFTDFELIRELGKRLVNFPMSVTFVDGTVYRSDGLINIESGRASDKGGVEITLIPAADWDAFIV